MIRSPAGYGGEVRIKRYLDYYQPSYGAMMLAEGLFGFSTPAGVLLGAETSGMAIDFTSAPISTLVRTASSLSTNYYSGLPFQNEGNGPVTFSRTSNATVTDSNGLIKWAGHNLLTNSESFDASAWTKSSATVTANSEAAPNNTTTGDTIAASGANGTALQSYTALAVPYTFGVWLKRKTGTGTIEIAADNGTYTAVTITSSWALYTVTQTPAAGSKSAGIRIVSSGDEVYAWGAHMYRSDLGGMVLNPARGDAYYPTTPPNLLGFTEDFSNAAWAKLNSATVTTNTDIAPNGLQTADTITDNSTGASQGVRFTFTSANTAVYTGSFYVKKNSSTYPVFQLSKATTVTVCSLIIDTSTGTAAVTTGSVAPDDYGVVDAGGYWRVWMRVTSTAAGSAIFDIYPAASTNGTTVSAAATGSAVFWGAQLSNSASLDAYSPVYGAAVTSAAYYAPRLDYDPVTLVAKGLLVEEQRANIILHSGYDIGLTSVPTRTAGVSAVTYDLGLGNNTALALDTTGGTQFAYGGTTYANVAASTQYTMSVYVKKSDGTAPTINQVRFACGNDIAITNWTATLIGNGVYRVSATLTSGPSNLGNTGIRITEANTGTYYVSGIQCEAGSFATSYIPTGASTATRTADVASVSTQAFPYNASASTLVVGAAALANGFFNYCELSASSANFGLLLYQANTVDRAYVDSTFVSLGASAPTVPQKLAIAYDGSSNGAVKNGGSVTSVGTTVSAPAVKMNIGSSFVGGSIFNGHIRQITYIPRRITDAELQARTA